MEEAAAYYRHRCLDLGLDKLQWWLEGEAAEWAEEETRHMRADYIWECSREARFGAERRVWQQWKAVTAIWGERGEEAAAAAKAAAVETAGGHKKVSRYPPEIGKVLCIRRYRVFLCFPELIFMFLGTKIQPILLI